VLADLTDAQQRGTVNAAAIRDLDASGLATPLVDLLRAWGASLGDSSVPEPSLVERDWHGLAMDQSSVWGGRFGMHRPTPLGVALLARGS
jgi:hypothetical protein